MSKYDKLIGKQFGDLKVLSFYGHNKRNLILWECQCSCGNIIYATSTDLTKRGKDSCGCKTKEKQRNAKKKYNKYNLTEEFGIGYTNKGEEFYFDLEDYELIKDICWNLHDNYIEGKDIEGKVVKQHRVIMNAKEGEYVDHINHDTRDNRKCNLRICTNQENCMNRSTPKNNTSGKSGVSWREDMGKWRVRIWKDYKTYTIGHYDTKEEAIKARIDAEKEYFGEFANKSEWRDCDE